MQRLRGFGGRLQAADQGIETAVAALKSVTPAVRTFYGSLDDEQKARLVARTVLTNAAQETSGRAQETTGRRSRWRDTGDGDRAISPAQWDAICGQWVAALRDWPVNRIERDVRLSETQRVAFYDVVAASLKAAGTLMTSCSVEAALNSGRADGNADQAAGSDPPGDCGRADAAGAVLRDAGQPAENTVCGNELTPLRVTRGAGLRPAAPRG